MPPVAYLRRSRVDSRRPGDVSHEQQLTAIRALAERHGDKPDELVLIEDWGRSGRASKQHLRAGFAELERMVKEGQATAIYAYSANRLARSLETLTRLAKLCAGIDPKTGKTLEGATTVPIRVHDGQSPDITDANGRLVFHILGSVAEWQAEWTQERMIEATKVRRARGDHMGPAPYGYKVVDGQLVDHAGEDFALVLAAYEAERTYVGTARRLNAEHVPTRAGEPWQASTIQGMLARRAPALMPRHPTRGRPPKRAFLLSGLLRCPCGATLTGTRSHGRTATGYQCKRSLVQPDHARPASVAESKLIEWIQAEADRLVPPYDQLEHAESDQEDLRTALEGRRARVVEAFLDGTVEKARRDAELVAIDAELDRMVMTPRLDSIEPIDWSWSAEVINGVLRSLFAYVELDAELRCFRAEWFVPEWRADPS